MFSTSPDLLCCGLVSLLSRYRSTLGLPNRPALRFTKGTVGPPDDCVGDREDRKSITTYTFTFGGDAIQGQVKGKVL